LSDIPRRSAIYNFGNRRNQGKAARAIMVKIAAWPTAAEAYRILCCNFGELLLRSGGWAASLLVLVVLKMFPWPRALSLLLVFATVLCIAVAAASLVIGWCRVVLQGESTPYGYITLTFGEREFRGLGYLAAIALLPGVPMLLLALLTGAESWWAPAFILMARGPLDLLGLLQLALSLVLLMTALMAGLVVSARLLIALPAVALDEPGRQFGLVWQHSRDSLWPLFYGWLACILPAAVPWALLSLFLRRSLGPSLAAPIIELLAYPLSMLALALSAGFFSYVYAQLVEAPIVSDTTAEDALPSA
jgi:hypothetical protein